MTKDLLVRIGQQTSSRPRNISDRIVEILKQGYVMKQYPKAWISLIVFSPLAENGKSME